MDLSPTERIIIRELQYRYTLSLKNSHENTTLSYRQFLRWVDDFVEKNIIKGWVPLIHPITMGKKFIFLFLKTNPKDPQDLDYLRSLPGLRSLDGIAGSFSMLALIQFQDDQDYLQSLSKIEKAFKVSDPTKELHRYFPLEIITFYKFNGVSIKISEEPNQISDFTQKILNALTKLGMGSKRPPTIENLANSLNISKSKVSKELKILFDSNIALGHSIQLSESLKPKIKMVVQFKIQPRSLLDIISLLQQDVHVSLICKTQSDYGLLSIVYFQSIRNFNLWLKEIYKNDDILDTTTTVILEDEFKNKPTPLMFPVL